MKWKIEFNIRNKKFSQVAVLHDFNPITQGGRGRQMKKGVKKREKKWKTQLKNWWTWRKLLQQKTKYREKMECLHKNSKEWPNDRRYHQWNYLRTFQCTTLVSTCFLCTIFHCKTKKNDFNLKFYTQPNYHKH